MIRFTIQSLVVATVLAAASADASEGSLQKCQQTVQKASAKFIAAKSKALGACLTAISREIVLANEPTAAGAAVTCAVKLAKIPKAEQKLIEQITGRCDPAAGASHTIGDIRGIGAGVSEPLNAKNIDVYCAALGGDGTLDTMGEWLDCIKAADHCAVNSATAAQFPRALEWLDLVRPDMAAIVPTPVDALAALDAANAAIEGRVDDDIVDIRCGHSQLPASGQLTSYTANINDGLVGTSVAVPDDGTLRFGAVLRYRDNGDGTVSDLNTGLMWEKKDDLGGLHDKDNTYRWSSDSLIEQETIWDWLQDINAEGGTGLAGHGDWRIPNAKELQSIVDYERFDPAVGTPFNDACVAGCAATSCSCTASFNYWTSTTSASSANFAWVVIFNPGAVDVNAKTSDRFVRAVRGAS